MTPIEVDPRTIIDVLADKVHALTLENVSLQAQLQTLLQDGDKPPCGCQEEGDGPETHGGNQAA